MIDATSVRESLPHLTKRQVRALLHPCARAMETTDPQFRAIYPDRGALWSSIVTVNK